MSVRSRLIAMRVGCAMLLALLAAGPAAAQQSGAPTVTHLQFDIVGVRLVVDPPALTVPKNIATQINTSLVTPSGLGTDVRDALATLTDGAQVEAELRGPSLTPTRIAVVPGQPLPIPPLALPGDYVLDGIRLVKNGETILDATTGGGAPATTIPIRVINEVLVASVTSKPLSLDDIRGKGIVIDDKNFSAVNFQVAFNIDGTPFTISAPAVLPTPELLSTGPDRTVLIRQISALNRQLASALTTLPPQFDRPGLNFSIAALPFFPVITDDNDRGFGTPPITGLIVIPGNVAFLNQFFSALLIVANVAPDGTPLELHDVAATISLPKGLDGVAGSFDSPGDDPLRLARTQGIGVQPTIVIVQRGPDGQLGTADDNIVIPPQKQGEGEFLIEGLKEGSQQFDIAIEATLVGLPSGPVKLEGAAAGSVFVRNPTFAVTLAHPRTVRSGEPYAIYATVTNTSRTQANLVTVNLDPRSIAGAQLLSDASVSFTTIGPGESAVARYSMRAQLTGQVTFSSFTGDAALGGGIRLITGVDERDVPLSVNAIVLPQSTAFLPATLVEAAQRVLGQAFSVATAPAEALPEGVLFVRRQTVIDRGVELAEAGERIKFGEPIARVIQDLLLDWLGNSGVDPGFDQIMRTTGAGAAMQAEFAAVMSPAAIQTGALEYQRQFAQATVSRSGHLSAVASGPPGAIAPLVSVAQASGGGVGVDAEGEPANSLVSAALLPLAGTGGAAALAVIAHPDPDRYAIELVAPVAGLFDLGVVVPLVAPGQVQQLQFGGIALNAGGIARVEVDLTTGTAAALTIDKDGDGVADGTRTATVATLAAGPPRLLAVRQLESSARDASAALSDPAAYGLLIGALFDEPVTAQSAELHANYTIASNAVIGTQLQHGGRLVYLYLQKPIGGLTPRSLGATGIVDARGQVLSAATEPIVMTLGDGAHVFGQVRDAGGVPVGGGLLTLTVTSAIGPTSFSVSAFRTDAGGGFDFDFVPRLGDQFTLTAQHPVTRDLATITARVRASGDQILLNPTFLGRGTVRGRVVAPDGVASVPNIPIALLPGSVLGVRGFQGRTNALGEFTFTDVPVGVFTLSAVDGLGAFGQITGLIARAGDRVTQNLLLVTQPDDGGRLMGRVFLSDGTTPGAGFTVYVGRYHRDGATIDAVDQTTADAAGTFAFARSLPAGPYDVVAVDPATQQLGATTVNVIARTTNSATIVLESVGAVEGVVFNGRGERLAGALVSGGVALATTDANGFFRIEGVPAGSRTIEAGDPVTRRRGSAVVTVLPGLTASAAITLESRATITGRVLDANGNPVPGASVRIPAIDGFTFVIANSHGVFTFPDMPLGEYLIQAPGPSKESLIDFMIANGIDPASAFTSGDAPGTSTPPSAGDTNAVLAAYQKAVQTFFSVDPSLLTGLPMASVGGFGWNKIKLFQDFTTVVADIKFLAQGTVSGRTVDGGGRPTGAAVRVSSLNVSTTGFPGFGELSRLNTDPSAGTFAFGGIALFDLATFQTAGVRAGDFTLEAANPFSPVHPQFRGQLSTAAPGLSNIVLAFPASFDTNGTVSGRVVQPDGVTPAPAGTSVAISFGNLTVTTDADGRFRSLLPIPAGNYTLTAMAPSGLRSQALAIVPAGGNVDVELRLLGVGSVVVTVTTPNGTPVANAQVHLLRASFPGDVADGVTDDSGVVRFVNITEGAFSITAQEAVTGLSGRTSAAIIRDGELALHVGITASGSVTGTFRSADGATPIAFAQIVLAAGIQAYASTDAAGRFTLASIPVGTFTIEGFDPLTNRRGRVTGELRAEGDSVDVTILEAPRGTVAGFVVNADGVTPVPAARVALGTSSFVDTRLQATALADGSFRFEGVPAGTFTLDATDLVSGFKGSAAGTLTFEGETIQTNIALAPFGSVHVTVLDEHNQPVSNASVTIGGRQAPTDPNGQITFENLALGTYQVVARSLADANNGGDSVAKVEAAGQVTEVIVRLRGVGSLTVTVLAASGTSVVASAAVTVNAQASSDGSVPGPLATTLTGFTTAAGTATFPSVPLGAFSVRAEAAALAGVASGSVPAVAASVPVQVRLGASGSVVGRVLLPDGLTAAAGAFVTVRFQSQSSLQSGVVQVTTNVTGAFEFRGIPLGSFQLSAIEVVSSGVRSVSGAVVSDGQRVDLGAIGLVNTGPRVVAVSPADRATNVAARGPVVLTFSAPVAPGSITVSGANANVTLFEGATAVPLSAPEFSSDNTTVTLRPARDLTSGMLESLIVKGAPDGPANDAGLVMPGPFVTTFTARDSIAPSVLSVSPAPGAQQVPPDATVRVAFSEPITGGAMSLRDAGSVPVPGTTTLASGGTVAIFTPADFLRANATYVLTVAGAMDLAGNPLPGGSVTSTFTTIDTLAPAVTALQVVGTARAGAIVTIHPTIPDLDVQRVEYSLGSTFLGAVTQAPFDRSVTLPADSPSTSVTAVAFDLAGNRSNPFALPIAIQPAVAPVVMITNQSGVDTIGQGQTLNVEVKATGDAPLAQIFFTAVGSAQASIVIAAAPGQTAFVQTFSVVVPATAASNTTITIQAAATDSLGSRSAPATVTLTVQDAIRPTLTILSPVNDALVLPGASVDVVADAADDVALASVAIVCNPALSGCGTQTVAPGTKSSRHTFTVVLPGDLQAPQTPTLSIVARDTSGNTTTIGRVLHIADTVKPTVTAFTTASGSPRVAAGDIALLRAQVTDNVGVTALTFTTEGGLSTSGTSPVAPPVTAGTVPLAIPIPPTEPNGSTVTVRVRARDAAGNASDEGLLLLTVGDSATPILTLIEPAAGATVLPGAAITVRAHATDDVAVKRFTLTATGVLATTDTRDINPAATPADAVFTIAVPAGTAAGAIVLTIEAFDTGGNSSGLLTRSVAVADTVAPQVQIVSPASGALLDPRNPVTVTVTATDAVGVSAMSFAASGTIDAAETRPVSPPSPSRSESFTVNVSPIPAAGGTLTLNASARDAAGNAAAAPAVTIQLRDVVAPDVISTVPINGASAVDPLSTVLVRFSEPMDRATLNATSLQLLRGATVVPVSLAVGATDDLVTLTPITRPLAFATTYTVIVSSAAADRAGNPLAAARSFSFTTSAPDRTPPSVSAIDPVNNATGVSLVAPIVVTFTQSIDPSTITAGSFRVRVGASAVAGSFDFLAGNTSVRFRSNDPLPPGTAIVTELTAAITDAFGDALAAADGSPLTAPITFGFVTGQFNLTSPAGAEVVENTALTLEARANASLGVASVVFTVNGQALPAVTGPSFSRIFNVGPASTTPTLTISASARDSNNAEVAHDQRTVNVVVGLSVTPTLSGVPLGGTRTLTFSISSPISSDLPIALSAGDSTIVSVPANPVILAAGSTSVDAVIGGLRTGATVIIGTSSHGSAAAIVAVSPVVAGQTLTPVAPAAGLTLSNPPPAATVVAPSGSVRAIRLAILRAPAGADTTVSVISTNTTVATATASTVLAGQVTTDLTVTANADGIATIIIRAGGEVRAVTVYVGTPPAGAIPLLMATPVGVSISNPPSAGQLLAASGRQLAFTVQLLTAPAAADVPVSVSSDNPGVAMAAATVIRAGSMMATVSITTVSDGRATLILRSGDVTRSITIFVGATSPGSTPILFASPVGVSLAALPNLGHAFAPMGAARVLTVRLLETAAGIDTPVSVTSSNAAIVAVAAGAVVRAGQQVVDLQITTGTAGTATLTIEAAGIRRELTIVVGLDPTPGSTPPVTAAPVGVTVVPNPSIGRVFGSAGAATAATLTLPLLDAPAASATIATVTSGNIAVVAVGGGATTTVAIGAGERVLHLPIAISGTQGAALLTIEVNGQRRELVVIVGNPPASQIPAVTAPIVGVRIGQ